MKAWKTAAAALALTAAAGIGATVAPVGHAQAPARVAPRSLDVLGGRGSQIGVSIRDLRDDDKAAQAGVVVEDVTADSPAQKAGIRTGDVITEFDGERVRSVRQFTRLVQETPAGRKAQAVVLRDGQRVNVTVEPREGNAFSVFRMPARSGLTQVRWMFGGRPRARTAVPTRTGSWPKRPPA